MMYRSRYDKGFGAAILDVIAIISRCLPISDAPAISAIKTSLPPAAFVYAAFTSPRKITKILGYIDRGISFQ
jgi:hypothetical protein